MTGAFLAFSQLLSSPISGKNGLDKASVFYHWPFPPCLCKRPHGLWLAYMASLRKLEKGNIPLLRSTAASEKLS